jgi:dTDP-glucose 4,6-dehydratase
MASLLIIGGSGFFGKSILDGYLRGLLKPWDIDSIIVLSRHASQLRITTPELMHPSISLVDADISTCGTLPYADYVIHAAASTDVANYLERPLEEQENIQRGTYNYCELAKKFHLQSKILYVSSGAVYGKQPTWLSRVSENFQSISINSVESGKKHYAAAKCEAESLVKKLSEDGVDVKIARCFAFIGKYLPKDKHFAIGNFIRDGQQGKPIKVNSTHKVIRSYMHADDLIIALMKILNFQKRGAEIFNVGSDEEIEVHELANLIAKRFGVKSDQHLTHAEVIDRYVPSIDKLKKELKYTSSYNLNSIVAMSDKL